MLGRAISAGAGDAGIGEEREAAEDRDHPRRMPTGVGRDNDALATLGNPAVTGDPGIQTLRARVMAAQGGYLAAIGILQTEIRAHPDLVAPRYYLGEYREKLGDIAGATEAFDWFVDG